MNLVLNAAFPLTKTYGPGQRLQRVQKLKKDGRPDVTDVAGRLVAATEEQPADIRVVADRLDEAAQREREAAILSALAPVMRDLGADDARLSTRFHGTVDLLTWEA